MNPAATAAIVTVALRSRRHPRIVSITRRWRTFITVLLLLGAGCALSLWVADLFDANEVRGTPSAFPAYLRDSAQYYSLPFAAVALVVAAWAVDVTRRVADEIKTLSQKSAKAEAQQSITSQWQAINLSFRSTEDCTYFLRNDPEIIDWLEKQMGKNLSTNEGKADGIEFVRRFLFLCYVMQTLSDTDAFVKAGVFGADHRDAAEDYWVRAICGMYLNEYRFIVATNRGFSPELIKRVQERIESSVDRDVPHDGNSINPI
ncbi:hypothetical protein [Sphingomonas sp. DC2300-3]|uniref:hypothetical protein n=1 Tax=unclassified Sphingomonas TaxID=196159 RepID=UPI003CEE8E6A